MFIAEETMKIRASLSGKRGVDLLHDPTLNKGTAFTEAKRSDCAGCSRLISIT